MIGWPLTPPTQLTLIISLLAAIFACLVHWLHLAVLPLETGFVVLLLSYLVLLAGNVFHGLTTPDSHMPRRAHSGRMLLVTKLHDQRRRADQQRL